MPRWEFGNGLSFRYGKSWQVEETDDPQVVTLWQEGQRNEHGVGTDYWWALWATGDSPQQVWSELYSPLIKAYPCLEPFTEPGNESLAVVPTELQPGDVDRIYQAFKGVSEGVDLLGFADARLYAEQGHPIAGLAVVAVGEVPAITRRTRNQRFWETFRYEPREQRLAAEARQEQAAEAREARQRQAEEAREAPAPRPAPARPAEPGRDPRLIGAWEHSSYHSAGGFSMSSVRTMALRADGRFVERSGTSVGMIHRDLGGNETGRSYADSGISADERGSWQTQGQVLRLDWDNDTYATYRYELGSEGMLLTPLQPAGNEPRYWAKIG